MMVRGSSMGNMNSSIDRELYEVEKFDGEVHSNLSTERYRARKRAGSS